jgi:4-amino-4-deoxy-L-arabinose transferase-like glycosyltransferase
LKSSANPPQLSGPFKRPEPWIFFAALAVRLAHFLLFRGDFWHNTPLLDDNIFVSWRDVIGREGFLAPSLGVFQLNPGVPYLLAAAAKIAGGDLLRFVLLQHLAGALAPVLLYRLAARLFRDARAGWAAAALGAAYGPAVFFESRLLGEFPIYLLNLSALCLLARLPGRFPAWLCLSSGACIGLSSVFRPTVLPFLAPAAVWVALRTRGSGGLGSAFCAGMLLAGAWLPVLPFQLRNRAVAPSQGWGLTTASGGVNLYLGNNPESDGLNKPPSFVHYGPGRQYQDFEEEAERFAGRDLTPREVSAFWTRRVLHWFSSRPGPAWSLVLRKMALFWNHREPPDNFFQSLFDRLSRLGPAPLAGWGLAAPLGLLGLLASLPALGSAWLLHSYVLCYFLVNSAFYILARYRFPAAAGLIPAAGFALVRLWDLWRVRGRRGRALGLSLLLLGCLSLSRLRLIGEEDPASSHYSKGVVYANQGWNEKAVEEYREAVAADGSFAPAWLNLGLLLERMGRKAEAADAFESASKAERDPAQAARLKAAAAALR